MGEHSHIRQWSTLRDEHSTAMALVPGGDALSAMLDDSSDPAHTSFLPSTPLLVDCRSLLQSPTMAASLGIFLCLLHSEGMEALARRARAELSGPASLCALEGEKPTSSGSLRRASVFSHSSTVHLMLPGIRFAPIATILAALPPDLEPESEVDVTSDSKREPLSDYEDPPTHVRGPHSPLARSKLASDASRSASRSSQRSAESSSSAKQRAVVVSRESASHGKDRAAAPELDVVLDAQPKPKAAKTQQLYRSKPPSLAMRSLMTDTPAMHLQREKNRAKVQARKQQVQERKAK